MPVADENDLSKYDYLYIPEKDYVGEDNFQFDVAVDGKTLRVYYQVKVFGEDENFNYVGFCNWERYYWKISSTPQALNLASLQSETALSTLLARAAQSLTGVADLPAATLAQTTGEGAEATNTLDATAAAHSPDQRLAVSRVASADSGSKSSPSKVKAPKVLGVCLVATVRDDYEQDRFDLLPVSHANTYFAPRKSLTIHDETARITVVQGPKHGEIELGRTSSANAEYLPARGYMGKGSFGIRHFKDRFTLRVEGNGNVVSLRYFVLVTAESGWTVGQMGRDVKECKNVDPELGVFKISGVDTPPDDGAKAALETGTRLRLSAETQT